MQQFLATGQALYVVAAVCGLGVLCKWVTRILYKRLIKEAGNLAMTKNRNLKTLRQRVETTYRTNAGVGNMSTYLERQMYDFRFLGVTLTGWGNFSNQMTFLCLLAGGVAAFLSYWYRSDSYYIVLYGAAGILAGLFTLMVDSGVNLNEKREQLLIALEDYMDNSLFFRPGKGRPAAETGEEAEEPENRAVRSGSVRNTTARNTTARRNKHREREETVLSIAQDPKADYLKNSLEQIAASRERNKEEPVGENWLKDLNPQEMKILGDIIKEYLA